MSLKQIIQSSMRAQKRILSMRQRDRGKLANFWLRDDSLPKQIYKKSLSKQEIEYLDQESKRHARTN